MAKNGKCRPQLLTQARFLLKADVSEMGDGLERSSKTKRSELAGKRAYDLFLRSVDQSAGWQQSGHCGMSDHIETAIL
jgi:hypothetical protein